MNPSQCIVNEYTVNQGIGPHIDRNIFGNTIVSLSLGDDTNYLMKKFRQNQISNNTTKEIEIPSRSLLILKNEARYNWTHSIPKRKFITQNGKKIKKKDNYRRISLTFRSISK